VSSTFARLATVDSEAPTILAISRQLALPLTWRATAIRWSRESCPTVPREAFVEGDPGWAW